MSNPHEKRLFRRIETRAIGPHGKIVTSWNSYPLGATYETYRRIDAALVRAFGTNGSKTVGTFMDDGSKTASR